MPENRVISFMLSEQQPLIRFQDLKALVKSKVDIPKNSLVASFGCRYFCQLEFPAPHEDGVAQGVGSAPSWGEAGRLGELGAEVCDRQGRRTDVWEPDSLHRCFSRSHHLALHMKRHSEGAEPATPAG